MLLSFYKYDFAIEYVKSIKGATISPVMKDSEGTDFWVVNQPIHWADTESVFDFIVNPFREFTHLGRNPERVWIVNSPEEGERFKYQACVPATAEESAYYWSIMRPELDRIEESYQSQIQEHLNNGGSMEDLY